MHEMLPLVIRRSPGNQFVAFYMRFERRSGPQVQWIRGLYVIMSVNHEVWFLGFALARCLSNDDRISRGLDFAGFETDRFAMLYQPIGTRLNVISMVRLGRDTWDSQILYELFQKVLLMIFQVLDARFCHAFKLQTAYCECQRKNQKQREFVSGLSEESQEFKITEGRA